MWDPCEFFVRSRGKTVLTTWNFLKSKNITFCSPSSYLTSQSQNISLRLRQVRQSGILTRQSKTKHFKIFWAPEKNDASDETDEGTAARCMHHVFAIGTKVLTDLHKKSGIWLPLFTLRSFHFVSWTFLPQRISGFHKNYEVQSQRLSSIEATFT